MPSAPLYPNADSLTTISLTPKDGGKRPDAGALVVTMVVAYFMVHAPNGILPHLYPNPPGDMGSAFGAHGGEVTILWFACAGIIGILGSRKYGIERLILKREIL